MTIPTVLGLATALAVATPQPPVPTIPPATPMPVESTSAAPSPAPSQAIPTASPSPATASAAPLFSAAPLTPDAGATLPPSAYEYRFVPRQPDKPTPGQPQIFAVYLNAKHLRSHGPIVIRVETNTEVVKMVSKSNGRGGAIPLVAPGVFFASSTLPAIPFIASGISTDLIFTGTSADGRTVTVKVPVTLG